MRKVILETPYAGDIELNTFYAQCCMMDCIKKGEAPFASHLIYPQVLEENTPAERGLGIGMGFMWGREADLCAIYTDLCDKGNLAGLKTYILSDGMQRAKELYEDLNIKVEIRSLDGWAEKLREWESGR